MSNIWFTADTHYLHDGIRRHCGRPFASIEEMTEAMIHNHNERVQPRDTVYHLGDFGWGGGKTLRRLADRLHGNICLILGNHDQPARSVAMRSRFGWIKSMHEINPRVDNERQCIILCHYAMRTWTKKFHGAWHLFGHSHGRLAPHDKSFDVGVDNWNFCPVSLDEVIFRMATLDENGE